MFTDFSGRFDHIMGNINTLYKSDTLIEHVQVIVFFNLIIIYFKIFYFNHEILYY